MGASLVAQLVKNLPASVRPGSIAESGRSPGEGIDYPLKNLDSDDKEPTCNAGDLGLNPGLGRSPGGGHGSPLQYSCLENHHGQRRPVDCSPWGHKESNTTESLNTCK